MSNNDSRVRKIRAKYGANIFRVWGKRGGSPILLAYARQHPKHKR